MNDKELADKVVALGVGKFLPAKRGKVHIRSEDGYSIGHLDSSVSEFVRDWRVAGALIEKVDYVVLARLNSNRFEAEIRMKKTEQKCALAVDREPCRAITEACVEALEPVLEERKHD